MATRRTRLRKQARRVRTTLTETGRLFSQHRALRLAAAISYYTAFALAPLLLVLVSVAGLLLEPRELQEEIVEHAQEQLGEQAAGLLERLMAQTATPRASWLGMLLGFAAALLGASSAVLTLKDSINTIFGVRTKPGKLVLGTLLQRGIAVLGVMSLGVLVVAALLAGAVVVAAAEWIGTQLGVATELVRLTNNLLMLAVLAVLVASVYKLLADVRLRWRQSWPAAVPTALLSILAQSLIGAYLGERDIPATYGAAASLAVVLVWIYLNAAIMLLGAAFLHAYMNVYRNGLEPSKRATPVRVLEETEDT